MKAPQALLLSVIGILAIGVLDEATGIELRLYPLYLAPLCFGAWYGSPAASAWLVLSAALTWAVSNYLGGLHYTSSIAWPFNVTMQALGFGSVVALVLRMRELLAREQALARVDPLTKLANRRAFCERAELELERAARTGKPVSIACLDVDNLKVINDWAGHLQGDVALVTLADVLRHLMRSTDVVARMGGDEFAVLLPESDRDQTRAALDRVRSAFRLAAAQFPADVSVSVGAVTFSSPPALETALSMADTVLYRVKRAGKDTVHVALAESVRGDA